MMRPKVAIVSTGKLRGNARFIEGTFIRYEEDVAAIKEAIAKAVELSIGGIDEIVKPGETVLVKPNLAFRAPPESFAVVDPRVVEAMISYLKEESKAGKVVIGDNPSLGMQVGRARPAFAESGMEEAARKGGVDEVIYFDETELVDVEIPEAKFFKQAKVFKPFLEADRVINLPKMKVHLAGVVTLGLKNWNGIVPNVHPSGQQQGCHRIDLGQKFADMYRIRRADLTIVDGVIGMEGQGPHVGKPVEMNLIIAGVDTVAVDAVTAYIMGFEPEEVPAVRCAACDGLGEMEIEKIDVVGEKIQDHRRFFKRPSGDPIGLLKGIHVFAQQTCPGCYVNIRGALDLFHFRYKTPEMLEDYISKVGEVVVLAGGVPDFEPDFARNKHLFVAGDCWKVFPTKEAVEEAMKIAKSVKEYPGCAPVYIFSQLNGDLRALAE